MNNEDIEKSLTIINGNLAASQGPFNEFGRALIAIAKETEQPLLKAVKAAEELASQGLTKDEVLNRTKAALILDHNVDPI